MSGLLLLIPLFVPVLFTRMTQDSFLFPKEVFFIASTGLVFYYRLWLIARQKEPVRFRPGALDALLLALLLTASVSIAGRSDFYPSLHPFVTVLAAALFYYELRIFNNYRSIFFALADCFIISGLAATAYAFMQYYGLDPFFGRAAPADKMRLFSFFGNKNYFSEYLCAVAFIAAGKIIILKAASARRAAIDGLRARLAFYYTALTANLTMIFIIQSRASFLAMAAGGAYSILAILNNPALRAAFVPARRAAAGLAAAAAIAAAVYSLPTPLTRDTTDIAARVTSIFGAARERNAAIRIDIWHATARMIRDNFWRGCGLGRFKMNYLSYQGMLLRENANFFYEEGFFAKANQAHNELLQIFCELGLPGFLAAAALLFALARVSRRVLRAGAAGSLSRPVAAVSVSAAIITVAVNSLFGFPLHILPTALLFLSCVAVLARLDASSAGERPAAGFAIDARRPSVAAVLFFTAAVFAMLFAAAPSYLAANIDMKAGLDCLKLDRHGAAEFYLARSIRANPFNGETRYYMGICHMQKKEYDKAVMEFLRSLQTESDPNIYSGIGMAFYKIGMYGHALEYMLRALELSPHDVYFLLNAGCALHKKGDFAKAVEYFQRALAFASTPESLINLGHSYYLMGVYEKAEAAFADALAKYGSRPVYAERIYYLTGLAQTDSKKYPAAIENFRRALALNPDNPDYSLNLGLALIFGGRTAEAELVLGGRLKKGFSELIAYNLGGLYLNEKRYADALVVLNETKASLEKKSTASELENDSLYRRTVELIGDARRRMSQNDK